MSTSAQTRVASSAPTRSAQQVAPVWHTFLLVALLLAPTIQASLVEARHAGAVAKPQPAVQLYIIGAIAQCVLFVFAWWGIRLRKIQMSALIGKRWTSWREFARDVGFALLFWGAWYGGLSILKLGLSMAGIENAGAGGMVYPDGPLQIALWLPNALLAGFVEEFVFRGYLMKQFASCTRSAAAGLVLQSILFGVAHAYLLGLRQVILISVSGILIGRFALWRGNLRSAMIFHGWADIFGAAIVWGLPFQ